MILNQEINKLGYNYGDNIVVIAVNVLEKRQYINNQIETYIRYGKHRYEQKKRIKISKVHPEKIPIYLRIWDFKKGYNPEDYQNRNKRKRYEEIAQILFKNEWKKIDSGVNQKFGFFAERDLKGDRKLFQKLIKEKLVEVKESSHGPCFADYIVDEDQLKKRLQDIGTSKEEQSLLLEIWRKSTNSNDQDKSSDEKIKLIQRVRDNHKVAKELIKGGFKDLK